MPASANRTRSERPSHAACHHAASLERCGPLVYTGDPVERLTGCFRWTNSGWAAIGSPSRSTISVGIDLIASRWRAPGSVSTSTLAKRYCGRSLAARSNCAAPSRGRAAPAGPQVDHGDPVARRVGERGEGEVLDRCIQGVPWSSWWVRRQPRPYCGLGFSLHNAAQLYGSKLVQSVATTRSLVNRTTVCL